MSASWTGDWLARTEIRKGEPQAYGEMPQNAPARDLSSESTKRRRPHALEPNSGPMPRIGAFDPLVRSAGATDGVAWTGDWLGKYSDDQARDPDGKWSGMGGDAARAHGGGGGDHGGRDHTIEHTTYSASGEFRQVPFGQADRGARSTHMQIVHGDTMRTGPTSAVAHDAAHARVEQATSRHLDRAGRASDNDLAGHLTEHHDIHAAGGSTMDPANAARLASAGRARMDDQHSAAHPVAARKFSDDQERGDDGKWTCGIDGCGSDHLSQSSLDEHQQHEHRFPGRLTAGRDVSGDDPEFRAPLRTPLGTLWQHTGKADAFLKYDDGQDRGDNGQWVPMGGASGSKVPGVGHHVPTNPTLTALHGAMHGRDALTPGQRDLALHHLSDAHGVHARTIDATGRPVGSDASIHEAHAGAHAAGL